MKRKKLLGLLLMILLAMSGCASKEKDVTPTIELDSKMEVNDSKVEVEDTNQVDDLMYCVISPIKTEFDDGFNYYWVYSHVGMISSSRFIPAGLDKYDFTLNKGNIAFEDYFMYKFGTDSKNYELFLLKVSSSIDLVSIDLDWESSEFDPVDTEVHIHDIKMDSPLSDIPEINGKLIGGDIYLMCTDDNKPINLNKSIVVYNQSDKYFTELKSGGKVTVIPFNALGDYSLSEFRDFLVNNMELAKIDKNHIATIRTSGEQDHVVPEPSEYPISIYLYREDGVPFEWDTLDNIADGKGNTLAWKFDRESCLYIVYDDSLHSDGHVYLTYKVPNNDKLAVITLLGQK